MIFISHILLMGGILILTFIFGYIVANEIKISQEFEETSDVNNKKATIVDPTNPLDNVNL